VILFLDTEFTDLAVHARLLSISLLGGAGSGLAFYAEVNDADRINGASWFAAANVLPQFGRVPGSACTYRELCQRLCVFLDRVSASLKPEEPLELALGYYLDWELALRAMDDAPGGIQASTRRRLRQLNVYKITSTGAAKRAADAYLDIQAQALLSRHHALCDARALRLAYLVASPNPHLMTGAPHAHHPDRRHRRQPQAGLLQPQAR
jgi:hypothetical protein